MQTVAGVPRQKKSKANVNTFTKGVLRRASLKWPPRNECLANARVNRGVYRCEICEELFRRHEVHVDHKEPVIPIAQGFTTWDEYIKRLLCDVSGLQCICSVCHDSKTKSENGMRDFYKKQRKRKK